MYLRDRGEAGKNLSKYLEDYRNTDAVIYALPRGGIVLGVEIAAALKLPLDLVIPRKIGHPSFPEYAIGAVTEHGDAAYNEEEVAGLNRKWFLAEVERQKREARRRRAAYMADRTAYPATGKIAILVDDGIATGLTMKAAILDIQRQNPARVVVAIPVVPLETAYELRRMVDDLVALDIPEEYLGAVGAYYANFSQIDDEEVIVMLDLVNPRQIPNGFRRTG